MSISFFLCMSYFLFVFVLLVFFCLLGIEAVDETFVLRSALGYGMCMTTTTTTPAATKTLLLPFFDTSLKPPLLRFQFFFMFTSIWGRFPFSLHIFFWGVWNHQHTSQLCEYYVPALQPQPQAVNRRHLPPWKLKMSEMRRWTGGHTEFQCWCV